MNSAYPLFRRMRSFLADQERALRATALAQSSRCATPEIRALYTGHANEPASPAPLRNVDAPVIVSPAAPLRAS